MKKLLLILLFTFVLVGCNTQETEVTFSVFDDSIYLGENEGTYIPLDYTGINEDRISVTFSNDSVLEFDESDFFIKAKQVGFTKILVSVKDSDLSASIDVYVTAKTVVAPQIQPAYNEVRVNTPFPFFIANTDTVGAPIESFDITFNDDSLASIDENYMIHPEKVGKLIVTATYKLDAEISSYFEVEILDVNNTEKIMVSTEANTFTVKPGEYLNLYTDGTRQNIEEEYYFSSYWTNYASVTADGRVIGIKNGLAYIGVKHKSTGKSGVIYLQVDGATNQVDYKERLLSNAMEELGYRQGSNGYTKFGEWYDVRYALNEWCAMFVAYNANEAGIPTTVIPRLARVEYIKNYYERIGRFQYKENYIPQRGDLIMFLSAGASHIGIVLRVENGRVYTIEGNTSRMVAERNYTLDNVTITGYGIPDYEKLNY